MATMEQASTDKRIDDLRTHVDQRFDDARAHSDQRFAGIDRRFTEINASFDGLYKMLLSAAVAIVVALIGLIATQL